MAEYYLMSQLPALDGLGDNMPVPITEERFLELCSRFLGKKAQGELSRLTLVPSKEAEKTASALIRAWNEGERDLRLALAKARADKMKKPFELGLRLLPVELTRVANAAVELDNPMEAERFLDAHRMAALEALRPSDAFSEDAVFFYGLKLKLLLRSRKFDAAQGAAAYKNIYSSIMNGEELEAIQ